MTNAEIVALWFEDLNLTLADLARLTGRTEAELRPLVYGGQPTLNLAWLH